MLALEIVLENGETCNAFLSHPELLGACLLQLHLHVQCEFDPVLVLVQAKKLALLDKITIWVLGKFVLNKTSP